MDWSPPGSSVHGILQARVLSGLPLSSPGDPPNPETDWGQQAKSRMPSRKRCLQGPLAQPAQATGGTRCRGGCCLQRCTRGPHGQESTVGLTGCKNNTAHTLFYFHYLFLHQWILVFSSIIRRVK